MLKKPHMPTILSLSKDALNDPFQSVFVGTCSCSLVRNSRSRFHGHENEDAPCIFSLMSTYKYSYETGRDRSIAPWSSEAAGEPGSSRPAFQNARTLIRARIICKVELCWRKRATGRIKVWKLYPFLSVSTYPKHDWRFRRPMGSRESFANAWVYP